MEFKTNRLMLRPMTDDDMPAIHAIYNNPDAMRYMPYPVSTTLQETIDRMQVSRAHEGSHHWSVFLVNTDTLIGFVNFLGETRIPGMGYIIHPSFWGQGYTVEACAPIVAYGFETLGYDRIELWIDERNRQSQRVANKLQFNMKSAFAHKYPHAAASHKMQVYGLSAAEWRGNAANGPDDSVPFYKAIPVLYVHDIMATVEYYVAVLGFELEFTYGDPPNHAGVSRGEWTGNLVTIHFSLVPPDRALTPTSYLMIFVGDDIDKLHADYVEKGATIVHAPIDQPWGMREFTIRDANGYLLTFTRNL